MKHCLQLIFLCVTGFRTSKKNQRKLITAATVFFLLINVHADAQKTLTGHIVDSLAKPLSGVTVSANKSKKLVISNDDGNFVIPVSNNDSILTFTYVGMKTVTENIGQETFFDVVLKSDVSGLNDVIVVGYGT